MVGALRHALACISTFMHVTILAHTPATHSAPHMDACGQGDDRIVNTLPGFQHHPPTQPVDVTSSTKLNYAEDVNLPDRRRGQHYKSCEEESSFHDCSGHSTSDGGKSPESDEELSIRKLPMKLSLRELPVKKLSGRMQSRRKAKLKISLADTGERDADLVSADTSTTFADQDSRSTATADTPMARLSQVCAPAVTADTPMARLSQTGAPKVVQAAPEDARTPQEFADLRLRNKPKNLKICDLRIKK
jgi:hypothetical protein